MESPRTSKIMKTMNSRSARLGRKPATSFLLAGFSALCMGMSIMPAHAATIAWWRFEDVNAGAGTTLTSQVNAPTLNGTLAGGDSVLVSSIPGPYVTTGLGGTSYANTQSIESNLGGQNLISGSGATALLNDTFVNNHGSWTWEAFVNVDAVTYGYGMLFGNGNPMGNGIQFDLSHTDRSLRMNSNGSTIFDTGTVLSLDTWTHVAVVAQAQGSVWDISVYVDHAFVGIIGNVALDTLNSDYSFFGLGNPVNAGIDEIRISDAALTPNEMLYAVPEPGTAATACLGLLGLVVLKRFRRALG